MNKKIFFVFLLFISLICINPLRAEETAEEKEPAQVDPVPVPMTLGNTPSSSDEEYVPQVYNTFEN